MLLSKFLTTISLALVLIVLAGLTAIATQLLRGHTPVEISAYLITYSVILFPTIAFMTAASIALNILLRDKYLAYLGPKDRHSIATSVRAWIKNLEDDERRRCGINYSPAAQPVPALRASGIMDLASHALTDVAINYRSFGPWPCHFGPQSY